MNKYTITKWSTPFPYRQLREIFSEQEIVDIFNDSLIYKHQSFQNINRRLANFFYMRYGKRYPYEQDKEYLKSYILQLKESYIDTFYNNIFRVLGKDNFSIEDFKNEVSKGNVLTYATKSGTSASPYNIAFEQINELMSEDYLSEKNLSETKQLHNKNDLIVRTNEIMATKLNGEFINFIDSFYSLFSQIDVEKYVEQQLRLVFYKYKDIVNELIDDYNQNLSLIKKLKGEIDG